MALLDLFIASSIPILKVLLVTALGSILALDHINILGEDTRKHMNNIVFFVFNPALVGSNLAKTITYESLIKLWFMPLNILITFIIGSALGWGVIQITRAPPHLRGLVLGCCAAGNLGNMLLIIIPAACKEKGSPFGDPDACHQYGMAYASLSMAVGAIYLWSYVYNIVRISSSKSSKEDKSNDSLESSSETPISQLQSYEEPLLSSKEFVVSDDHAHQFALPCTRFEGKAQVPTIDKVKQQFGMLLKKVNLKRLFAPSTTGALVGFIVGLVPQIRMSMIGDRAPLCVIQDSISLLGSTTIRSSKVHHCWHHCCSLHCPASLIGITIVKGALFFGLVEANPLYQFILLLQFALPPAMNIGMIISFWFVDLEYITTNANVPLTTC